MEIMMMTMRKQLGCFSSERKEGINFEDQEGITKYDGLESCILSSGRGGNGYTMKEEEEEEDESSLFSSKDGFGSFSSQWMMKKGDQDECDFSESPHYPFMNDRSVHAISHFTDDVDAMKQKFAMLLLGEDISGGTKSLSTALTLSNSITNLAVAVFGDLWKLEPLADERKKRWRLEMDWMLSPAKYMIELIPAKQTSIDGSTVEIMIPKLRRDMHLNLPALQKLDSLLIEMLDSMVDAEFWYIEGESGAEDGRCGRLKWWQPWPQVPKNGLSLGERRKLLYKRKVAHQVFKAAKSINQNVVQEIPVPAAIRDTLPKSGKANLGEELYKTLSTQSMSALEMLDSLNIKSEDKALETINNLECAILQWKERFKEQESDEKTSFRSSSWSFMRDPSSEIDRMEELCARAEALLHHLNLTYPNLPQTFLHVNKIQYGQDIGHSILEAYSRVLGCLAFNILTRISDVLREDAPDLPSERTQVTPRPHSLLYQMNLSGGNESNNSLGVDNLQEHSKRSPMSITPCASRVWCIGREACGSFSPQNSP